METYQQYGIDPALVERMKLKLKQREVKDRVKAMLKGVTKHDLQNRAKVKHFVNMMAKEFGERLSPEQAENLTAYVISQKIDPNNSFHLIKLWSMLR
jgi:DNA replication protein DnaD